MEIIIEYCNEKIEAQLSIVPFAEKAMQAVAGGNGTAAEVKALATPLLGVRRTSVRLSQMRRAMD